MSTGLVYALGSLDGRGSGSGDVVVVEGDHRLRQRPAMERCARLHVGAGPLDVGFGVTGGGRVGFRINVNDLLGFFVDVGPMLQYITYSRASGPNYDVWHYQFVLRAGASFGLGGG